MSKQLIIIGGSAGSLEVLLHILPELREDLNVPIVIVLHRKATNDNLLSQLLAAKTKICVQEAEEKESIRKDCIYIAPADYHLLIEDDKTFSLDFSEKINFSRPSIDVSFQSAAEVYKSSLTAILLSGANTDGTEGLREVVLQKGTAVIQDPQTAEVDFMPRSATAAGIISTIMSPDEMVHYINELSPSKPNR